MECMGTQNDFIYMPTVFAQEWTRVAQQMTDFGLAFTYTFYTAIFGITSLENTLILRSTYLDSSDRADNILRGNRAVDEHQEE